MCGLGQRLNISGPNLGSLLLAARHNQLRWWVAENPFDSPIFGSSWLIKIFEVIDSCGIEPTFTSGRVGTHQQATKLILGKERFVANVRFRQGEKDDTHMDLELVNLYFQERDLAEQRSVYEAVSCESGY